MSLVRVERFFNGSKMIFYFTADNRVDFRELVKDLVQEFRTRVEMRQVGVRHETKMLGGMGTCGRELCCSLFMKKFESVSIKMAKEQDLPLNPSKISGVCNRLLCCLTYEYDTYRRQRKGMPKPGGFIKIGDEQLLVKRQNPLQESIIVGNQAGEERLLIKREWQTCEQVKTEKPGKRKKPEDE
jgi:cell fate regulator YaaT (PSP1 superfamily)